MPSIINARLSHLGIKLPPPLKSAEGQQLYQRTAPYVRTSSLLWVSGQGPIVNGAAVLQGRLGAELTIDQGIEAARLATLHLISQCREACDGDLDRVERVVRLCVYVCCTPDFHGQATVATGASQLLVDIWGERGRHARSALGVCALPFNVSVELDAVFELRDIARRYS
jgi:enamine deaminase RidA (YjgF/YER057c/UK114 family)